MRLALVLGLLGLLLQEGPQFVMGMSQGEGLASFFANGPPLDFREAPRREAPIVNHVSRPEPGTELLHDSVEVQTWSPGEFVAREFAEVHGRNMGRLSSLDRSQYYRGEFERTSFTVRPGDRIQYLQYRAEASCFVRWNGSVWDVATCPNHLGAPFELTREPSTEWWIRAKHGASQPGWLLVTDSTISVRRSF